MELNIYIYTYMYIHVHVCTVHVVWTVDIVNHMSFNFLYTVYVSLLKNHISISTSTVHSVDDLML